jgi:hypothetical protein
MQGYTAKPKQRCTLGKDTRLYSNHYTFQILKPFVINHYDINIFAIINDKITNEESLKEIKSREEAK